MNFGVPSVFLTLAIKKWPGLAESTVFWRDYFLPHTRMRSKGLCDRSWCLYIYLHFFLEPIFYLPKYSLSEVHFNTDRLLIEFNGLWYSLAARQVFVAIANPDSLSFG